MFYTKIFLVFLLGTAFSLAEPKPEFPISSRGLGDWFVDWKNSIQDFVSRVFQGQKLLVKHVVDLVIGTVTTITSTFWQLIISGFDFDVAMVRFTTSLVTNNVTKTILKDYLEETKNQMDKNYRKVSSLIHNHLEARPNLTYPDLIFVLTNFGDDTVSDEKAKLLGLLQRNYNLERPEILNAVDLIINSGEKLGLAVEDVAMAGLYTYLTFSPTALVSFRNANPEFLDSTVATIKQDVERAIAMLISGSTRLANVSADVFDIGYHVGTVSYIYGLDKLNNEDKENVGHAMSREITGIKKLEGNIVHEVNAVAQDIQEAGNLVTKAGFALGVTLPSVNQYLLNNGRIKMIEALNELFSKIGKSVTDTLRVVDGIGEVLDQAGKNITEASLKLQKSIPKFGFGLIKKEKSVFDPKLIRNFEILEESFFEGLGAVYKAGDEMQITAQKIKKSAWEISTVIPTFGLRPLDTE